MSLARLLEQATPGPWLLTPHPDDAEGNYPGGTSLWDYYICDAVDGQPSHDARLIGLAPVMAQLLIDMAAEVERVQKYGGDSQNGWFRRKKLLARFAVLDGQAKDTT